MISEGEYRRRAEAEEDWAPGWDAITEAVDRAHPGVEPAHRATLLSARAMFGGPEYLDGVSLYPTEYGTQHLVTYGMSCLYTDPESYGGEFSGWGYEMTMQVAAGTPEECTWAVSMLGNVARYTWTSKTWFEPYHLMVGRNEPIKQGSDSALTGFITVPDPLVPGVDTVHGRLDFLQVVGITQTESDWLVSDGAPGLPERTRDLADRIAVAGNTHFVTDLARTESYLR
ncbi:MAG: suppressor of fused domain protein [Propionibacteriaceae bacterium]